MSTIDTYASTRQEFGRLFYSDHVIAPEPTRPSPSIQYIRSSTYTLTVLSDPITTHHFFVLPITHECDQHHNHRHYPSNL
ncbi:hypothetical protein BDW02DRAFT_571476, partial [Decorospora gaudefroyi]